MARAVLFRKERRDGEVCIASERHAGAIPQLQDATPATIYHITFGDGSSARQGFIHIAFSDAHIAFKHFDGSVAVGRFALINLFIAIRSQHRGRMGRSVNSEGCGYRENSGQ